MINRLFRNHPFAALAGIFVVLAAGSAFLATGSQAADLFDSLDKTQIGATRQTALPNAAAPLTGGQFVVNADGATRLNLAPRFSIANDWWSSRATQACTFTLSPAATSNNPIILDNGSYENMLLTVNASASNCAWTVTAKNTWLRTIARQETGSKFIVWHASANAGGQREDTINFSFGTAYFRQDMGTGGGNCTYSINPTSAPNVPAAGVSGSFAVSPSQTSCQWAAVSNQAWITLGTASGTGSGTVNYTVAANTGAARTGTISASGQTFTINQAAAGVPQVTSVTKTYSGFFLKNFNQDNTFTASVNWNGTTPGKVRFQINNNQPFEVVATPSGASRAFNMNTAFTPNYTPSLLKITPVNSENVEGATFTEKVYVFPNPTWLDEAVTQLGPSVVTLTPEGCGMLAKFKLSYPTPPFKANVTIPESIPFLGGKLGIKDTTAGLLGSVSSCATGKLSLGGKTGFEAMGQEVGGKVLGSGSFALDQNGLSVTAASFKLGLNGTLSVEKGITEVIPALIPLSRFRVIKQFNKIAKLKGELKPSVDLAASWKQDPATRRLKFDDATGQFGLEMRGTLSGEINKHVSAEAWLAGKGDFTVGFPAPHLRAFNVGSEVGVQIKINKLLGGLELKKTRGFQCSYTSSEGAVQCGDSSQFAAEDFGSRLSDIKLEPIHYDYKRFGDYEAFRQPSVEKTKRDKSGIGQKAPLSLAESSLVTNVFPGAQPIALPVGGTNRMVIYVRQNPSLPTLQSTEIAWLFYNGTSWSQPAVVQSDTRAEMSPVAATDASGKVVAAWLRVKDPAYSGTITTLEQMPDFYKQMEVVSATFDPAAGAWSAITQLTDDAAFDTALNLAADASGKLLLTWQSNPGGDFVADAASPGTLKYSFWNGTQWNAPGIVAGNLTNVGEHAAAVRGTQAFIIAPRDPDFDADNDRTLASYVWNGAAWSAAAAFAGGAADNFAPSAVYDQSGQGQIVWRRGNDLVRASLSNPTPQTVRAGSSSMAFYNTRLLVNAQGNLTLIWQETADNQPANIFAAIYDNASQSWSADVRVNEDTWQASDANGYYSADGKLYLAYLATQINRVTRDTVVGGQTVPISNLPENGQTDLRLLEHTLINDLAVSDASLEISSRAPAPGEALTATLNVRNAGHFPANNFAVNIYAGNPAAGGTLLGSVRIVESLPAGASRAVPFAFNYPTTVRNIVAVIDAGSEIGEFSETNNTATVFFENAAPTARVTSNVTSGAAPLAVSLSALTSTDPENDALTYSWAFGDGTTNASGAQVAHTFTQTGQYPVTLFVTDAKGATDTAVLNINAGCQALTISPNSLPGGQRNVSYQQTLSATGGSAPYSYYLAGGALPAGVTLSPAGVLSGTPTEAGTFNFTAASTYANNCPGSGDLTLTITGPTASAVTLGGRVTNAAGRGINRASVTLTGGDGQIRTVLTNQFGRYQFTDVEAGATYVIGIAAKNHTFAVPARVLSIAETLADIDFRADN